MNETMLKFGYPHTLIREFGNWTLLLRPQQATLGAVVLVNREPVKTFGALSAVSFADLGTAVRAIETALFEAFQYDKVNYLMLMMVDPDVHFHILPRYGSPQQFAGTTFADPGWPGPPRLEQITPTDAALNQRILAAIKDSWS